MNHLEQFKLQQIQQMKNIKMEAYKNINEKFEDENIVDENNETTDQVDQMYETTDQNLIDSPAEDEELVLTLDEMEPDEKLRGTYY